MGKIWLKSPDPNKQCCGCEGKTSPCDSCLSFFIPLGIIDGTDDPYDNLTLAQQAMSNTVYSCIYHTVDQESLENQRTNVVVTSSETTLNFRENIVNSAWISNEESCNSRLPQNLSSTYTNTYGGGIGSPAQLTVTVDLIPQSIDGTNSGTYKYLLSNLEVVPNARFVSLYGSITDKYLWVNLPYQSSRIKVRQGENFFLEGCSPYTLGNYGGNNIKTMLVYGVANGALFETTPDSNRIFYTPFVGNLSSIFDYGAFFIKTNEKNTQINLNYSFVFNQPLTQFSVTLGIYKSDQSLLATNAESSSNSTSGNGTINYIIEDIGDYYIYIQIYGTASYATSAINGAVELNSSFNKNIQTYSVVAKYLNEDLDEQNLICT